VISAALETYMKADVVAAAAKAAVTAKVVVNFICAVNQGVRIRQGRPIEGRKGGGIVSRCRDRRLVPAMPVPLALCSFLDLSPSEKDFAKPFVGKKA
jgi:hypothetical protein